MRVVCMPDDRSDDVRPKTDCTSDATEAAIFNGHSAAVRFEPANDRWRVPNILFVPSWDLFVPAWDGDPHAADGCVQLSLSPRPRLSKLCKKMVRPSELAFI
jgi:hypothetical protein